MTNRQTTCLLLAGVSAAILLGGCRGKQPDRAGQPQQAEEGQPAQPSIVRGADPVARDSAEGARSDSEATRPHPRTQPGKAALPQRQPIEPPGLPVLPDSAQPQHWADPPASQPATAPAELVDIPGPGMGQYVVYSLSLAGPQGRLKQTVESLGPAPGEVTIGEQMLVGGQPVGRPRQLRMPRSGRQWPGPLVSDARTVAYSRERIDVAGRSLDCIVLTIESRSAGSLRVEKEWICPQVPITHIARLVTLIDGREAMRQEVVDFGVK